jgi:Zn-dependent peptidase ImmA (M78 family)
MPGKDTNIGAKRARETRAELGLAPEDPPACLLTLVEQRLGIPVAIAALHEGVAGYCWRGDGATILWVNGTQPLVRRRFTLAHELGHVRCRHRPGLPVDTFETLSGQTTDAREVQANAFAAELLAPRDGVRAMLDGEPTLDDVVRIAARYGISHVAALYRLSTLELTRRPATLKRELEAGHAAGVRDRLALDGDDELDDELARIAPEDLPRLPPALAGSALAGVAAGTLSIDSAADAASVGAVELADGAATIGV